MNILVVDDNEQNCHLLQVFLARKGNAVVTAANGAEALEKARLNPPDLIITDILMPVMDGFSLCREWKQDERLRDIPLIFYTGTYVDERDREFALGLGAARLIVKPEDLDNLLRTIQAVMAEQERGRLAVSPKTMQGDVAYLKEYNEALIRKLEDKMRQLEQTNRELKRDIIERKRAEEALRESEIRFRELFDNINSGVAVYEAVENGTDFVLKDFNRAGQRIEETSKQDVLGRRVTEVFPGVPEMGLLEVFQRVWRTGQPEHHPATLYRDERMVGWRENYVYKLPSGEVVTVYDDVTARRNVEEDLRRSETKFRTLYDSTSDAVMLLDLKGFFDCNQAALAIFGCATREEFCSKHPADVSPPMQPCGTDSLTLANRRIVTAMEQGSHHFEWMHKRADTGETFPADVLLSAMELDGKRVLQAVVRDITERKRAEEALRASEELYRQLFNAFPDGIIVIGSDALIKSANRAQSLMYRYASPEEMVGISPSLLIAPAMREFARGIMCHRLSGEEIPPLEYRFLRKDGTEFWGNIFATLLRNTSGSITGYICVTHDTTVRKRAEEVLRESELRFRTVYERAAMGIVVVDVGGRIAQANAFFQCMLGRSSEDLVGRKFEEFTHPEEAEVERASFQKALEEGSADAQFQKRYVRNDGQTICANLSSTICRDAAGKPQFVIGLVEDITERKRAEEDLRSSHEQFRALAARIEHVREEERAALARELHDELGQGLTALQIDLAWLDGHLRTAGLADLPMLRDKIAAMVPRAERLIETTQAISSTMRPGVLDDLGLVAAIEWLAADFEKRTGLACMATLPATDIALDLGLAVVLFRIVQEALTNVIRHAKATRVEIRLRATEGELTMEVEDNGRGIVPQQIADPRSLGLFSMRERAAALGGTVDFGAKPAGVPP